MPVPVDIGVHREKACPTYFFNGLLGQLGPASGSQRPLSTLLDEAKTAFQTLSEEFDQAVPVCETVNTHSAPIHTSDVSAIPANRTFVVQVGGSVVRDAFRRYRETRNIDGLAGKLPRQQNGAVLEHQIPMLATGDNVM